jgi:hypothetical protein
MPITRREFLYATVGSGIAAGVLGGCASQRGEQTTGIADLGSAEQTATEAAIFGYPLVASEVTRVQMTDVSKPDAFRAPMGQFFHQASYAMATSQASQPNFDTLESVAWIDVGTEPWVLSWPDMHGRYYMFPVYSLWMSVISSPGTRTTGDGAQAYAITGPDWVGTLPPGVGQIKSPTRYAFILGRTACTGTPQDYAAVDALQAQYRLYPLSAHGRQYTPAPGQISQNALFDIVAPVRQILHEMQPGPYFALLAKLLKDNPPSTEDAPMVEKMRTIGLVPGQDFDMIALDPLVRLQLRRGRDVALDRIKDHWKQAGTVQNHWVVPAAAGRYGTDYLLRAFVAEFAWPAGLPQDSVHAFTRLEANGEKLSGEHRYVLRFEKGTPPVKGFWSITVYDAKYQVAPQSAAKCSVSSRGRLQYNGDGSLELYLQREPPGIDKEANWIATPQGNFTVMLRMYWPTETPPSILPPGSGTWKIPAVQRVG